MGVDWRGVPDILIGHREAVERVSGMIGADAQKWEALGWSQDTAAAALHIAERAQPFWLSGEMQETIVDAAVGIPETWVMRPTDLPQPFGLAAFENVIDWDLPPDLPRWTGQFPLAGFVWGDLGNGLAIQTLLTGDDGGYRSSAPLVKEWGRPFTAWSGEEANVSDETRAGYEITRDVWRLMATFFNFCQQRIFTPETRRMSRASRRRAERQGVTLRDVVLVKLRPLDQAVHAVIETGGRELTKRFVVRAHWRNQWHPSIERHMPKWIRAYIKGPDGAPLDDPVKVWGLIR